MEVMITGNYTFKLESSTAFPSLFDNDSISIENNTDQVTPGFIFVPVSRLEKFIEVVLLCIIAISGGIHNFLILVAGCSKQKLHRGINVLVLNMAAVDFLANVVVNPLYACAIIRGSYPWGDIGCKIEALVAWQDIGVSVFTNFAIAINRCALTKSRQSCAHRLTSTRVTRLWVVLSWLIPLLTCTGPIAVGLIDLEYHYSYNACLPAKKYRDSLAYFIYNIFLNLTLYMPLIAGLICYVIVWRRVKSMTFNKRSDVSRKRYLRTTQNVAIIFIVFCICWVPDTLHWMLDPSYESSPVWVTRAGVILYFANSAINPFLFAWRFPAFRKTMVHMLSTRAQRQNSMISTFITERRYAYTAPGDKTTSTPNPTSRNLTIDTCTETSKFHTPINNNTKEITCYISSI